MRLKMQSSRGRRKSRFQSIWSTLDCQRTFFKLKQPSGMIPVTSDSKEITDADVENVVKSALTEATPQKQWETR